MQAQGFCHRGSPCPIIDTRLAPFGLIKIPLVLRAWEDCKLSPLFPFFRDSFPKYFKKLLPRGGSLHLPVGTVPRAGGGEGFAYMALVPRHRVVMEDVIGSTEHHHVGEVVAKAQDPGMSTWSSAALWAKEPATVSPTAPSIPLPVTRPHQGGLAEEQAGGYQMGVPCSSLSLTLKVILSPSLLRAGPPFSSGSPSSTMQCGYRAGHPKDCIQVPCLLLPPLVASVYLWTRWRNRGWHCGIVH